MIFKSITIKEGIAERTINFSDGVTLIHSDENSKGKTTLLRFILYSLGYSIPNTRNIKFDRCEVNAIVQLDDGAELHISRLNNYAVEVTENCKKTTFILPDQLYLLHERMFCSSNKDILDNLLGVIYADQEKGWTLLNRGTAIGSIRFNIEEFVRGLSGCDCVELLNKEKRLSRELSKYRQMFSVAKYRESIIEEAGILSADSYDREQNALVAQLSIRQGELQREIKRIDKTLSDNRHLRDYVLEMKILVQLPDGTQIPVTADNVVGLTDTIDFLVAKRKMVASELQTVMHQIESSQKEYDAETEQLAFFDSESLIEIFDKKIASVPIDAVAIEKEIKRLEKTLKAVRKEISTTTKSNTSVIMSLYHNMVKYATELNVGNSESIASSYLFTSNLKELSGAVLHKTVFAFRLAYLIELEKLLGIKLPLILDSPSGKEVDHANVQRMVDILKRDFSDHQIIIASIYRYAFDDMRTIEIINKLIE